MHDIKVCLNENHQIVVLPLAAFLSYIFSIAGVWCFMGVGVRWVFDVMREMGGGNRWEFGVLWAWVLDVCLML